MKTSEFLKKLLDDVKILKDDVKDQFCHLSYEHLNYKQAPDRWSILECFEHLNRYNHFYLNAIEKAFETTTRIAQEETRSTWIGKKSIEMMQPSNRKKQKTFKHMNPANSALPLSVMDHFLSDQNRLVRLLENASDININSKMIPVEFFRLFKMNIGEGLEFIVVHQQRHVLQAHTMKNEFSYSKPAALAV
jgi:hypothetical protein